MGAPPSRKKGLWKRSEAGGAQTTQSSKRNETRGTEMERVGKEGALLQSSEKSTEHQPDHEGESETTKEQTREKMNAKTKGRENVINWSWDSQQHMGEN